MATKRLVNVSDAARILSVSTKTIRRWDAKLGPQRDCNGYRVYDPDLLSTDDNPVDILSNNPSGWAASAKVTCRIQVA